MSNLAVNENWKDADGMVVAVPNHNYIKLRLVKSNAANGKNETVIMKADDSGKTFSVIKGDTGRKYGRRAPKKIPVVYSMDAWDDYFWDKINKDWHVKGTEENETKEIQKKGGDFAGIEDPDVKDILHILLDAANKIVEEQYSVNIENIPDEDLKRGQEIISELAAKGENISVAEFNNMLMELWLCIPRVICRMNKEKVYNKSEFKKKLEKEQELLDFLMSMLRGKGFKTFGGNILTQNNLVWESVSKDEEAMLKNKMGDKRNRYLRAWRVTNTITEDRFSKYCTEHGITEKNGITELFHGSGTPNWWSIATNGLYLNPSGVQTHGKMFGYGLYFAPYAGKSIGYTSSYGSYWEHGNASRGYLAVFKVATGNIYDIYAEGGNRPQGYDDFHANHPDKDCLWAGGRGRNSNSDLVNDEVIVYREDQATIKYLIEFSA